MNLVFICLESFPYEGACTNLLANLLSQKEMHDLATIHVLSMSNNTDLPSSECIDDIHISRFSSITRMSTRELLLQSSIKVTKRFREVVLRVRRHLPVLFHNNSFFTNPSLVSETINAIEQVLKSNAIDIIIPVCGYYEAAVAAMSVCKRKGIALGIYQVDPCATNRVLPPSTYKERMVFEKALYDYAKFVITTPIIHKEMEEYLTIDQKSKIWIMEFPNVALRNIERQRDESKDIRCLFTGKLYPGARDPRYTIRLFSCVTDSKIKLELVGVDQASLCRYIGSNPPENVICRGNMSIEDTRKEIDLANVLVNIGNVMNNQVPSKLFEYIASGKPIINICVNKDCPSIPYMEKYPLAINLFQSDEQDETIRCQAERLQRFIQSNFDKNIPPDQIQSLFYMCTPEYCSSIMVQAIKSVKLKEE